MYEIGVPMVFNILIPKTSQSWSENAMSFSSPKRVICVQSSLRTSNKTNSPKNYWWITLNCFRFGFLREDSLDVDKAVGKVASMMIGIDTFYLTRNHLLIWWLEEWILCFDDEVPVRKGLEFLVGWVPWEVKYLFTPYRCLFLSSRSCSSSTCRWVSSPDLGRTSRFWCFLFR